MDTPSRKPRKPKPQPPKPAETLPAKGQPLPEELPEQGRMIDHQDGRGNSTGLSFVWGSGPAP